MVRKKGWVWIHYKEEPVTTSGNKKAIRARCNYCGWRGTNSAERLLEHLITKCDKAGLDVKEAARRRKRHRFASLPEDVAGSVNMKTPTGVIGTAGSALMSGVEVESLQEAFARAIYHSSLPLGTFDTDPWRDFFRRLAPEFHLPGKWKLANTLLDREYRRVRREVETRLGVDEVLKNPAVHHLCNLLDPRKKGIDLTIAQTNEATEYIKVLVPSALDQREINSGLLRFFDCAGEFALKMIWERLEMNESISPLDWWVLLPPQVSTRCGALRNLAKRVLATPTFGPPVDESPGLAMEDGTPVDGSFKLNYVSKNLKLLFTSESERSGKRRRDEFDDDKDGNDSMSGEEEEDDEDGNTGMDGNDPEEESGRRV